MIGLERVLDRARLRTGLLIAPRRALGRALEWTLERTLGRPAAWAVGLIGTLGACCVTPPSYEELLDFGFGTPEQAFESFRTGVRADSFVLEYRCFSAGWKRRNGASLQAYIAFRDQLMRENRFLRKGLADLEIQVVERLAPDRALIQAETHGRSVTLALVRDDYLEVYVGAALYTDAAVQDLLADQVIVLDEAQRLWGRVDLNQAEIAQQFEGMTFEEVAESFSRVTFGREWKIDDFAVAEAPQNP